MVTEQAAMIAALRKYEAQHKYDHGHALVLSGGVGRGGAARLAARAALRVGAGLVTLGCPPAALSENAARLDAIMLRALRGSAQLRDMLADPRITALCLGPGLGLGAGAAELVATALERGSTGSRAVILDADAVTHLAQEPGLQARLHPRCILTPHAGEFARLLPDLAEALRAASPEDQATHVQIVQSGAARLNAVLLLKGALTVIAAPDGTHAVSDARGAQAAPWLATAGSGDVLAGLVTGLAARGIAPLQAAFWAALLHVAAARAFGPGLIADDLPDLLPAVLRDLGV
ncbi:MAG: NAD(P)H-hydrate dehydratase [Rhodobacteraceae bacterium]|nr:NAD(P)H-hydrate dehydratase [Paracoccaceae bacterium]